MTRREFFQVGARLEERSSSYLESCMDEDYWAACVGGAIANYAALARSGMIEPQVAVAAMLALSNQE